MTTTRVTPYLGGTGRDNRNKLNVHATLNRVSIGADVNASANLQVFGNSYANVAEANLNFSVKTLISNSFSSYSPNADFQIAKSGELKFNLYSNNSIVRQDFTSTSADFSIVVWGGPQPNVTWLAGAGLVNAYAQVNEFIHTNNVYVLGNLFVQGTTTVNNVEQTIETANTQSANAYYLTKATSDISMSNGWTFQGTNVAHFAYNSKRYETGIYNNTVFSGNTHVAIRATSPDFVASNSVQSVGVFGTNGIFSNSVQSASIYSPNGIFSNSVQASNVYTTGGALTNNGFLGLGITSPQYPLDVRFSRNILNINFYNSNTDPAAYSTISLTSNGSSNNVLLRVDPTFFQEAGGSLTKLKYSDWNQHVFRTQGQAQLAQLGTTGFKIGTGAATSNLDVTGNVYATARVWSDTSFSLPTSIFREGGQLGINTINPVANLHVLGNAYINTEMQAIRIFSPSIGVGTQTPAANIHNMGNLVVVGNTRVSSNLYISTKMDIYDNVFISSDLFQFRSPQGISIGGGTTATRGDKAGTFRYNEDFGFLEYTNDGVAWANVGSGSGSGGGSPWLEDAIKNVYLNNTAANISIGGVTSKSNLEVRGNVFVLSNLAVGSNVFIGGGPSLVDFGLSIQVASGIQQSWNTNLTGATRRTWGVQTETNAGDWSILTSTAANTKPSVARLTIDTSGRLGLGIVVPTSNLHIVGNAYVSTDLFIAGNSTFTGNVVGSSNVVGQQLLATNGLILNANTLIANYTVAAGYNAVTVGPFVIPASMNVTVAADSRWVIL